MNTSGIREHMKVVGSDRQPVGTVDKVEGDQVCLRQRAQEACQQWQA